MKKQNILILVAVAIATVFIASVGLLTASKTSAKVTAGGVYEIVEVLSADADKIVDFVFLDDDGNRISLSDYTKGKVIFQNFWGTWCPPCRAEIPDIVKLQEENIDKVVMVGIALERKDNSKQSVIDYAKSNSINYINFVGPKAVIDKLTGAYKGISGVPTTYIANKDGKIVDKIIGARSKADFQKAIDNAIK